MAFDIDPRESSSEQRRWWEDLMRDWYNGERLHSALGYLPPDEYEQAYWAQLEQVPQTA